MQEVLDFLKTNATFFLATVEGDQPRVRPFGAISEFEGKLYLITNNQKDVFRQITENEKVELCAIDKEGIWLRLTAKARRDDRREAVIHFLEDVPLLQKMYQPDDGIVEVFCLEDATATFHSFTERPRTIRLQ